VTWRRAIAVLPGIGVSLLTKLTCPMCWPAYAGLLSTLGLSFLLSDHYLLALMVCFFALSVASLAFRARQRQGYAPTGLGLLGASVVVWGKFYVESTAAMYFGLALLIAASLWNIWPPRPAAGRCCPAVPRRSAYLMKRNA